MAKLSTESFFIVSSVHHVQDFKTNLFHTNRPVNIRNVDTLHRGSSTLHLSGDSFATICFEMAGNREIVWMYAYATDRENDFRKIKDMFFSPLCKNGWM